MTTETLNDDTRTIRELAQMLGARESRLIEAVKAKRLATVEDPDVVVIDRGNEPIYLLERQERGALLVKRADFAAFLAAEGTAADRASPAGKWAAQR